MLKKLTKDYIKAFNDKDLKFMRRSHNSQQAINCIRLAKKVGFENITIDLIYGLACAIDIDNEKSTLWIELMTEKFEVVIYSQNYSKTEKSIEQLVSSDLKGI